MHYRPPNDPVALGIAARRDGSLMPTKGTVILIRWPVVFICSSLILFRTDALDRNFLLDTWGVFYLLSNVGLYFVKQEVFRNVKFNVSLVALDTVALTASLIASGQAGANFYLAYFLLIIICCVFENPGMIAIVSFLAPFAYAGMFFDAEDFLPGNYLQLAFLFVVGFFYGHFSQLVRIQRNLREQAEQRNQAKTELLNILSHELKTPLTVIASYAQALKGSALGEINRDQENALSKILRQTGNLETIVNVILESASVETGTVAVAREELVLSEFLNEIKQNCDGLPVKSSVTLVWDYPVPMPVVKSDPGKLQIVLLNLIHNAIKFTDAGEIRIRARNESQARKMTFAVSDSGIGIAADQLPFVFDKFWQVDAARTRTQSGIGMGLYIVKAFTELLGGSVSVTSTLGK